MTKRECPNCGSIVTQDLPKRGFTRPEAAEYLGVSVWKIAGAIRDNELPAKHHGRDVLLLREDLDDWLNRLEPY